MRHNIWLRDGAFQTSIGSEDLYSHCLDSFMLEWFNMLCTASYTLHCNRITKFTVRTTTQTIVDMCCHSPVIYFPAFYIFKGCVYAKAVNMDVVKQSMHQYLFVNFKEDMRNYFIIWSPCIFLCFFAIPIRYRVPWINFCGIAWVVLLSVTRGEEEAKDTVLEGEASSTPDEICD
eukprot:495536_1